MSLQGLHRRLLAVEAAVRALQIPPPKVPFCVDCKFYSLDENGNDEYDRHMCAYFEMTPDIVTGKLRQGRYYIHCYDARSSSGGHCGAEGGRFRPCDSLPADVDLATLILEAKEANGGGSE